MSRIIRNVLENARRMHAAGLMDDLTMREFEALALPAPRKFTAKDVVRIRKKAHVSQSVFAAFLNVSKNTVASWEQDEKKPSGPASKLLDLVDRKGLDALA
jgi:putative transcriptional regulator